jgi:hypothetical protein
MQWPPFTNEHLFEGWSWEYYWAGSVVSLDGLIAGAPGSVFWVDTEAILGWDCCAVARDIGSREGYTLRRGCYVYYEALQAAKPVPPLDELLSGSGTTDLAPRFGRSGNPDS